MESSSDTQIFTTGAGGSTKIASDLSIVFPVESWHVRVNVVSATIVVIVCTEGEGSPADFGFTSVHCVFPFDAVHEDAPSVTQVNITEPVYGTLLLSVPLFDVNEK